MTFKTLKKQLGQYFTPKHIAEFMVSLIDKPKSSRILEPSAGTGVFLRVLHEKGYHNVLAFEIDPDLEPDSPLPIYYADFLQANIGEKFDVIIGNPPYVRWRNIPPDFKRNFKQNTYWKEKINGLSDLLYAFIYRSVDLLAENGELIFITPSFWTNTLHSGHLRNYMLSQGSLELVVSFEELRIIPRVSSHFLIFKFVKRPLSHDFVKFIRFRRGTKIDQKQLQEVLLVLESLNQKQIILNENFEGFQAIHTTTSSGWHFLNADGHESILRIENACKTPFPIIDVNVGHRKVRVPLSLLQPRNTKKKDRSSSADSEREIQLENTYYSLPFFIMNEDHKVFNNTVQAEYYRYIRLGDIAHIGNGLVSGLDKAFKIPDDMLLTPEEQNHVLHVIKAKQLEQYTHGPPTRYMYLNCIKEEQELKQYFPHFFSQLYSFKTDLMKRYNYGREIPWWHFVFPRNYELMASATEKIFVPCKERIDSKGYVRFTYVRGEYFATQDVTVIVKKSFVREDLRYLTALLNSRVIFEWLVHKGLLRGGVLEFSERPLSQIPIRLIDWENEKEVKIYNEIINHVNHLLNGSSCNAPVTCRKRINELVHVLYLAQMTSTENNEMHIVIRKGQDKRDKSKKT